ncbi:sulfite exporter TauE/SafE family protein [Desulfoluna butyratoxydans]|uniref:Probable membrane transporter protein n=1 Tax=Desulfoluna butyratoxydans TaxID=231438 RepID=A0A4U8YQS8_9BACT|nr:sulfite exporter TauE/SafE family protein [Desulfoluna butyratoxydans]VFQ45797.1 transmembrane protein taue-like [Desulfoluna butyratoxydans]
MNDYLIMALFWGLGGLVNGIAGFGCALVATPLATQFIELPIAIPAGTIIGLAMNMQMGLTFRKYADWDRLRPLIFGAFPGALTGVTLMKKLPGDTLKLAMGIFLITYALWGLFFEGASRRVVSKYWGVLAGFSSSAIGTSFGMGGPPTIVYTSLTGWRQEQIKAGIGSFFMCAGIIMITAQTLAGLQSTASVTLAMVAVPSAVSGGWIGIRISRLIGDFSYRKILFSLLGAMGCMILYKATMVLL